MILRLYGWMKVLGQTQIKWLKHPLDRSTVETSAGLQNRVPEKRMEQFNESSWQVKHGSDTMTETQQQNPHWTFCI